MKGWLNANLFFLGLGLTGALLASGGIFVVRRLGLGPEAERIVGVLVCIAAIVITGLIARKVLLHIERR